MYDCLNCGMPPDTCVCVPWCYRHDGPRPCKPCETDPEPEHGIGEIIVLAVVCAVLAMSILTFVGLLLQH